MARRDTCCFKCTYFHLQSTPGEDGKPEDAFGLCRRYAPKPGCAPNPVGPDVDEAQQLEWQYIATWPEVSGIDWCGEFA